jgi:alcohol dehydrogenase class IV
MIRGRRRAVADRFRLAAEAMGADVRGMSDEAAGLCAAAGIEAFVRESGLPTRLRDVGVPREDLVACAEASLSDGSIVYNARTVSDPAEVLGVLEAAW